MTIFEMSSFQILNAKELRTRELLADAQEDEHLSILGI